MNRLKTIGTWLLGIVMLGMAFWAFRLWMAERIITADPTIEGYTKALSWNPGSDEYHAILGDGYRNLLEGYDLDAAARELKRYGHEGRLYGGRSLFPECAGSESPQCHSSLAGGKLFPAA